MRKISHLTRLLMAVTWFPFLPSYHLIITFLISSSLFPFGDGELRWREVYWLHIIHCKGNWQRSSSFKLPSGCLHLLHLLLHVTGNMEKMDGEREYGGERMKCKWFLQSLIILNFFLPPPFPTHTSTLSTLTSPPLHVPSSS